MDIDEVVDVRILQNTFYSEDGDLIQVRGGASEVEILNNILYSEAGYGIFVENDSQSGFFSDYNVLHRGDSGHLVFWTTDFDDILDWQEDVHVSDLHSIGSTAIDPDWAQPRFRSLARDDLRLFDITAKLRFTSPSIDAGAAFIDQGLPASAVNLLSNSGFEAGLADWTTNVEASATGSGPGSYFGATHFTPGGVAVGMAEQTIDLLADGFSAAELDSSDLVAVFGGRVRMGDTANPDHAEITLTFLDGTEGVLGSLTLTASRTTDRWELVGGPGTPAGRDAQRHVHLRDNAGDGHCQ